MFEHGEKAQSLYLKGNLKPRYRVRENATIRPATSQLPQSNNLQPQTGVPNNKRLNRRNRPQHSCENCHGNIAFDFCLWFLENRWLVRFHGLFSSYLGWSSEPKFTLLYLLTNSSRHTPRVYRSRVLSLPPRARMQQGCGALTPLSVLPLVNLNGSQRTTFLDGSWSVRPSIVFALRHRHFTTSVRWSTNGDLFESW